MSISNTVYIRHLGKSIRKTSGELFTINSPFHYLDDACETWKRNTRKCDKKPRLVVVFDGPGTFCLDKQCYTNISFTNPNSTNQDVILILDVSCNCPIKLKSVSFSNVTIKITEKESNECVGPLLIIEDNVVFGDDTILDINAGNSENNNNNPARRTKRLTAPNPISTTLNYPMNPLPALTCDCNRSHHNYGKKEKDKDKCPQCEISDVVQIYEPPFNPLPDLPFRVLITVQPNSTLNNTSTTAVTSADTSGIFVYIDNQGVYTGNLPVSVTAPNLVMFLNRGTGRLNIGRNNVVDETVLTVANWENSSILLTENMNVEISIVNITLQTLATLGGLPAAPPPVIVRDNVASPNSNIPILFRFTGPDNPAGIGLPSALIFNQLKLTNLTNQTLLLTNTLNYRGTLHIQGPIVVTGQTLRDNATGPISALVNDSSHLTNGSLFLLYRTITENFTHTQYDGQVFHIDASNECKGSSLTITLPDDPLWNGRILQYKRIDCDECNDVMIVSNGCIDGKQDRIIYLDPFEAIELQNRAGHYLVLSHYRRYKKR